MSPDKLEDIAFDLAHAITDVAIDYMIENYKGILNVQEVVIVSLLALKLSKSGLRAAAELLGKESVQ